MDNPFEQIIQELADIKTRVNELKSLPNEPIEVIDRAELMKRLNITEPTIIRYEKRNLIPTLRIGSAVRYNWPSVIKALETR